MRRGMCKWVLVPTDRGGGARYPEAEATGNWESPDGVLGTKPVPLQEPPKLLSGEPLLQLQENLILIAYLLEV